MLLSECIENCLDRTYPFFTDTAFATEVLDIMQEKGIDSAPVLHDGKAVAVVTLADVLPARRHPEKKEGLRLSEMRISEVKSIGHHEHLFDLFEQLPLFAHSIIPVSDDDGRYAGIIEQRKILRQIAEVFHLGKEATTLELELPSHSLKLSEVIATLEKNDATLLSFGSSFADSDKERIIVTFRVQTHDQFRLVKNMEKYGYTVRYASPLSQSEYDELREKALEFIRYMDM